MDGDFWFYFAVVILLVLSINSTIRLIKWRKKTILYELIASVILLIYIVLDYLNLSILNFISGTVGRTIFMILFFGFLGYLLFYDDIKQFFIRRKMKGKRRALNGIENSLLFYCLVKHKPDKEIYYYKLGYEPLDNNSINEIISAIKTELSKNGIGPDNEPNEHGLQLKYLVDKITETYLPPESKQDK